MTEHFAILDRSTMTLSEFIDNLDRSSIISELSESKYDKRNMQKVANWLQKLANNKSFLSEFLINELKGYKEFQSENDFKPSTLLLHKSPNYTIRAVIWLPTGSLFPPHVFAYYEPHDHNFDFFTTAYLGSGYTTSLYEYNYEETTGFEGELIDIKFKKKQQFKPNLVMYYYASKDIHIQYPPNDLTITLNLIIPKKKQNRQYEFAMQDSERDCKATIIRGQIDRVVQEKLLFQSIASIGNETSLAKLRHIATSHPNELTRAEAWTSLIESGQWLKSDNQLLLQEKNDFVTHTVHKKLSHYLAP